MNSSIEKLIRSITYKSDEERKIVWDLFLNAVVEERSGIDAKIVRKLTKAIEDRVEKDLNDN